MCDCEAKYQAWWDDLSPVERALARELYREHLLPGPFVTSLTRAGLLEDIDPHGRDAEDGAFGIAVTDGLAEFLDSRRATVRR